MLTVLNSPRVMPLRGRKKKQSNNQLGQAQQHRKHVGAWARGAGHCFLTRRNLGEILVQYTLPSWPSKAAVAIRRYSQIGRDQFFVLDAC